MVTASKNLLQNETFATKYCNSGLLEHDIKHNRSELPGFLVRSGVLDDDETTGVNSASSGSNPVILILQRTIHHNQSINQSIYIFVQRKINNLRMSCQSKIVTFSASVSCL